MEVVVTTGPTRAISRAKLQSNHHQQTNIQQPFLQAGRPSCRPTNSVKALKRCIIMNEFFIRMNFFTNERQWLFYIIKLSTNGMSRKQEHSTLMQIWIIIPIWGFFAEYLLLWANILRILLDQWPWQRSPLSNSA